MQRMRQNSMQSIRMQQHSEKAIRVLPLRTNGEIVHPKENVETNELKPFLEDLMKRYDKVSQDLQMAQFKNIEYNDQNQKLILELDKYKTTLKTKEEELQFLYSKLKGYQNKHEQQIDCLQNDNVKVVQVLTQKIEKLNDEMKTKQMDLEQTKGLLILREQEVLEWRSRKQLDESKTIKELNQVKKSLADKEQELQALRIKYEFKQKTNHLNTESQQELSTLKQELYIKEQQLSLISAQENSEQCVILQREIQRLNRSIVELRSEVERLKEQQVDYEWLKTKYQNTNYSTLRV